MTASRTTKYQRINLRLNKVAMVTIDRAASIEGKTVSNFILSSALTSAERAIQEHQKMTLGKQDSDAFLGALSKPTKFNAKLLSAFEKHNQHVHSLPLKSI